MIHSFPRGREIIAYALSDRIVTALVGSQVQFLTKQVVMLEPLLMGYLAHARSESVEVGIVGKMLEYMDTSLISKNLISKLIESGFYNAA